MANTEAKERVNPIYITLKDSGNNYELDFNRDSVRFAEAREFKLSDVSDFPQTKVPELFFYSFRMHHRTMSRQKTDELLDKLGGVTPQMLERLVLLYQQAQMSNILTDDEDYGKNGCVTVVLD